MPIIEVTLEDDVVGEQKYNVFYTMTSHPVSQTQDQPEEGAEFEISYITNRTGRDLKGSEFDAVAEVTLDCYYEEMLTIAMEGGR